MKKNVVNAQVDTQVIPATLGQWLASKTERLLLLCSGTRSQGRTRTFYSMCKYLLKCHKEMGPTEALNGNVTFTDFHFSLGMWIWAVMSLILFFSTSEKIVTWTESGGVSHGECDGRRESAETKQKLKLVIAMFSWQHPQKSTLGVDYNGILVLLSHCAKWIQSQESGLHGWTINSRGNESQAWVLVSNCAPDQDRGINTVWANPRSHTN